MPARPAGSAGQEAIVVRGARVHNLKNVDCEIPHNRLTVVTGVSGSGKSSLAFDTIYAEGQRRYIESLSAYARQFLERMEKPDVDEVTGIAPAVAIRQKNATRNPRSTVATATEVYDYLRLLYARVGVTLCRQCGGVVRKDTVDEIAGRVLALESGRRFYVLFPLNQGSAPGPTRPAASAPPLDAVPASSASDSAAHAGSGEKPVRRARALRRRSGAALAASAEVAKAETAGPAATPAPPDESIKPRLFALRQSGFNRLYQRGRVYEFSTPESLLEIDFAQPVYILVDRLSISPEIRQRLIDSVELCYREAGEAILEFVGEGSALPSVTVGEGSALPSRSGAQRAPLPQRLVFNERFECKRCGIAYLEPEPNLFSFNNPYGACPRCQGFGNTIDFDLNLVVPDKSKTLAEGAVDPWTKPRYRNVFNEMKRLARSRGVPLDVPYHKLTAEQRRWIIEGDDDFIGVQGFFQYLERKKYKLHVRVFLSRYRGYALCPKCKGGRLREEALNVRVGGKAITEVCAMSIDAAYRFFTELRLAPHEMVIADKVFEEIRSRLKFMVEVGLEYLTLDRLASTLSGGESQRIQLATALGSNLVGALYVLDEPSIGLHPRDTGRLIAILKSLRDIGNTILVVEHDPEMMRQADKILDLGPGAGENGGRILYEGSLDGLVADAHSLTGRYLSGDLQIPVPATRRKPGKARLRLRGARQHNLKSIDVDIPLNLMVCVSGVSGSGKSTLVHDVLFNALLAERGFASTPADYDRLEGGRLLFDVILVDQSPLGRTPRSNPITYIKAFDAIREVFASTPEGRKRGYPPGTFSFNVPGGRCETCQGDGTVTVEMQFLADVELVCEECRGRRYKSSVLEVRYKGKNIYDVLQLTVKEALAFFAGHPKVTNRIRVLDEVGLGYLRLGQSATTLSGGEAQRVRLAAHLAQHAGRNGGHPSNGGNGAHAADPFEREYAHAEEEPRGNTLFIFDEPTTGLHFDDINKLLAAFRKLIDAGGSVLIIEHNLDVLKTADWIIDLGPEGGDAGGYVVVTGPPEALVKHPLSHTGKYLAPYLDKSA
ncbi:MAG TPA: excinuclease ABC subunit UvrA [Terriglobia bacterium]|nr:excinuclease ABC subunit UvrA [Terriglobia bacterium]